MSYRICYEKRPVNLWRWGAGAVCLGVLAWCILGLGPVFEALAAGEGVYDSLARYVGGMILGTS